MREITDKGNRMVASALMSYAMWERTCRRMGLTPEEATKMPGAAAAIDNLGLISIMAHLEVVRWADLEVILRDSFTKLALANPQAGMTEAQLSAAIINLKGLYDAARTRYAQRVAPEDKVVQPGGLASNDPIGGSA